MSLRYEQYSALRRSRDYLRSMLDPKQTPKLPRKYRTMAYRCLRHFPCLHDSGQPMWSKDPFTKDVKPSDHIGNVTELIVLGTKSPTPMRARTLKCRRSVV